MGLSVLVIAGPAGSGKSSVADAVAAATGGSVVRLDDCYHTDPALAPSLPRYDGPGRVVNFSDPAAIDLDRFRHSLTAHAAAALVIVEGMFALALPAVAAVARWRVYVDTPADISIARKTLRKIGEGRDPQLVLRGYLEHGRDAHLRHIAPTRRLADLVLDGTQPVAVSAGQIRQLLTR